MMAGPTENELREALASDKVARLIRQSIGADTDELLRDLRPRRPEMEFEIAEARQAATDAFTRYQEIGQEASRYAQASRRRFWPLVSFGFIMIIGAALGAGTLTNWSVAVQIHDLVLHNQGPSWAYWGLWALLVLSAGTVVQEIYKRTRGVKLRQADYETTHGYAAAGEELEAAQASYRARVSEVVARHVTDVANGRGPPRFKDHIIVRAAGEAEEFDDYSTVGVGLSDAANDDHEIPTEPGRRLIQMVETLPGGSIGVSGPRGVGKSTLLRSACGPSLALGKRPVIATLTSAPIEYQPREFLLHLFSSLCRRVLEADKINVDNAERAFAREEIRVWHDANRLEHFRFLPGVLTQLGVVMMAAAFMIAISDWAGTTFSIPSEQSPVASNATTAKSKPASAPVTNAGDPTANIIRALGLQAGPFAMLGLGAFLTALAAMTVRQRLITSSQHTWISETAELGILDGAAPHDRASLIDRSLQVLRNIRFQRNYTSGWSGAIKVPMGVEMGATAGLALQQQAESLPELVTRFRDYVRFVTRNYGTVIFGIDELDKLRSPAEAEAFLNGIKAVFGIENCFFLISVSEDALSAFDRRGIGVRDAFDSSLDDILRVDFLNLENSRVLLNRRVLRLPDPFLQLCYMLSGGLPRDLIRHARQLLETAMEAPNRKLSLEAAAHLLIAGELVAKKHATQVAIRALKVQPSTNALLTNIVKLSHNFKADIMSGHLDHFEVEIGGMPRDTEDERRLARLGEELAAFYRIMILTRQVAETMTTEEGWQRVIDNEVADRIAEARQALEVSVPAAAAELDLITPIVDDLDSWPSD